MYQGHRLPQAGEFGAQGRVIVQALFQGAAFGLAQFAVEVGGEQFDVLRGVFGAHKLNPVLLYLYW